METQNPENSVSFVNDAKHMDCRGEKLDFDYGAQGKPAFVRYGGNKYAYVYNLQGDVVALLASTGETVVQYEYDAWGKPVTMTGELADTLGRLNPFRYRGYVFDEETGLYYLRSRYYDPVWGRFVNADTYISTGQGVLNHNVFAYCKNTPVNGTDPCGTCFHRWDFWNDCEECGGRSLGEKFASWFADAYDKINRVHRKEAIVETGIIERQTQMVTAPISALWKAYVHSIEIEVKTQYDQDMRTKAFIQENFSTWKSTLRFITKTYDVVMLYVSYVSLASGCPGALVPFVMGVIMHGLTLLSEME